MTAASSGSTITHSPRSSALNRDSAESARQVLNARLTASKRAWMPSRSDLAEAGSAPAIFTVQALPMVSPESSVSAGRGVAQAASSSAAAAINLLRQYFKRGVVRGAALLHVRRRGLVVLDADVQPVQARRGPGDAELAIGVGLDDLFLRRIAITRAAGDDFHVES